jgi:hypothetical protein
MGWLSGRLLVASLASVVTLAGILAACTGDDPIPAAGGEGQDGVDAGCPLLAVPDGALTAISISFQGIDTGVANETWRGRGFDRDGHCTTQLSTDVCQRVMNASASTQEDGDAGIDNSWGHFIQPVLAGFGAPATATGFLTTDPSGDGTLLLDLGSKGRLSVPVKNARIDRHDPTATVSLVVPTESFITQLAKLAARGDPSYCDPNNPTLVSIENQVRSASDIPVGLDQNPAIACNGISLGGNRTGIADVTTPDLDAGNPCP